MAVEKWTPGSLVGLTWTAAITSSVLNSIAIGNAILSDVNINNSAALDMFADVSIALASAAFVAPNFVGLYLYPLDADGATYGDGRFGASAAGPPPSQYYVGSLIIPAATAAATAVVRGILLPPGQFKFCFYNGTGVALAASGNTASYRTYNYSAS
jgi:hypothetical protein